MTCGPSQCLLQPMVSPVRVFGVCAFSLGRLRTIRNANLRSGDVDVPVWPYCTSPLALRVCCASGSTLPTASNTSTVTWGYGGRVLPERYPVMAWPQSSDCPLPGANATSAAGVRKMGIDSIYYDGGNFKSKCGHSYVDEINSWNHASTEGAGWFHAFTDQVCLQVCMFAWYVCIFACLHVCTFFVFPIVPTLSPDLVVRGCLQLTDGAFGGCVLI